MNFLKPDIPEHGVLWWSSVWTELVSRTNKKKFLLHQKTFIVVALSMNECTKASKHVIRCQRISASPELVLASKTELLLQKWSQRPTPSPLGMKSRSSATWTSSSFPSSLALSFIISCPVRSQSPSQSLKRSTHREFFFFSWNLPFVCGF